MSRQLKFRVWSFLEKAFYYFTLEEGYPQGIACGVSEPQQYTEVYDSNKQELFDGDIVSYTVKHVELGESQNLIAQVMYVHKYGAWGFGREVYWDLILDCGVTNIIKIGNIFENSALLDQPLNSNEIGIQNNKGPSS